MTFLLFKFQLANEIGRGPLLVENRIAGRAPLKIKEESHFSSILFRIYIYCVFEYVQYV